VRALANCVRQRANLSYARRESIMAAMAELQKQSVAEIAAKLERPFSMMDVALVGDILVSVYICDTPHALKRGGFF
jgi:hypothetical protein